MASDRVFQILFPYVSGIPNIFISLHADSIFNMGRNKYAKQEIEQIKKLLRLKNSANRSKQKLIRHELRVNFEFNISDFNEAGKAFGEEDLEQAIKRGAIVILDDATIEAMKAKRARDKARDEAAREEKAVDSGEATDWKAAMKEWEEWKKEEPTDNGMD